MSTAQIEHLEQRALEQRREIHESAEELRTKIRTAKQKFDARNYARSHFARMAMAVSIIGLLSGYSVAGAFTRR